RGRLPLHDTFLSRSAFTMSTWAAIPAAGDMQAPAPCAKLTRTDDAQTSDARRGAHRGCDDVRRIVTFAVGAGAKRRAAGAARHLWGLGRLQRQQRRAQGLLCPRQAVLVADRSG